MQLMSRSFGHGQPIPEEFAFGAPDPTQHIVLSGNRNPQLSWLGVPPAPRSRA